MFRLLSYFFIIFFRFTMVNPIKKNENEPENFETARLKPMQFLY